MDNKYKDPKDLKNSKENSLINQEIKNHYESALNNYSTKVEAITRVLEQDELIKLLYEYKLEALMNYNRIFNNNADSFGNSLYLSWYNTSKKDLEQEIAKIEDRQLESNIIKSEQQCKKLLSESYAPVSLTFNK
jgi:hypothetical protein